MKHRFIKQSFLKKCLLANMIAIASSYSFAGFVTVEEIKVPDKLNVVICQNQNTGKDDSHPVTEVDYVLKYLGEESPATIVGRAAKVVGGSSMRHPSLAPKEKVRTKNVLIEMLPENIRNLPGLKEFNDDEEGHLSDLTFLTLYHQENNFKNDYLDKCKKDNASPYDRILTLFHSTNRCGEGSVLADTQVVWNRKIEFQHSFASIVPVSNNDRNPGYYIKNHLQAADALPSYISETFKKENFKRATVVFQLPEYRPQAAVQDTDPRFLFLDRLVDEDSHQYPHLHTVFLTIPEDEDEEFLNRLLQTVRNTIADKGITDESESDRYLSHEENKTGLTALAERSLKTADRNARKLEGLSIGLRLQYFQEESKSYQELSENLRARTEAAIKKERVLTKELQEARNQITMLSDEIKKQEDAATQLRENHDQSGRETEARYQASIQELKNDHQKTIEENNIKHEEEMKELRIACDKENDEFKEECNRLVDEANKVAKDKEVDYKNYKAAKEREIDELANRLEDAEQLLKTKATQTELFAKEAADSNKLVQEQIKENNRLRGDLANLAAKVSETDAYSRKMEDKLKSQDEKNKYLMERLSRVGALTRASLHGDDNKSLRSHHSSSASEGTASPEHSGGES